MRLAQLSDGFIINLDLFREAIFYPSDGTDTAELVVYFGDGEETEFHDDEAITVWFRLKDLAREGTADG